MFNRIICCRYPRRGEEWPTPSWYIIHTRSRCEIKVETDLARKGLETFLPRERRLLVAVELLGRSVCAELAEETVRFMSNQGIFDSASPR